MKTIAEFLEVEEGEIFTMGVKDYKIENNVLLIDYRKNGMFEKSSLNINHLLTLTITKKPWFPRMGEGYFYPIFDGVIGYRNYTFVNDITDKNVLKTVGFFRTKEEAISKSKELGWFIEEEK